MTMTTKENEANAQQAMDAQTRQLVDLYGAEACVASIKRCTINHTTNSDSVDVQHEHQDYQDKQEFSSSFLAESILDASFDASFLTDDKGIIQNVNSATLAMFQYDHVSELSGKNISVVIGGPHAHKHSSSAYFASATQSRIELVLNKMRDVTGKRKDGSEFPVQVGIKIIESPTPSNTQPPMSRRMFVAYCHDLSRHKGQLEKLQREKEEITNEQRLTKSILDSSFDAIIMTDAGGTILQVNQATLTQFGYDTAEQLLSKDIKLLVGGTHAEKHASYLERFRHRGATSRVLGQTREVLAKRRDGSEFPCRIGIQKVPGTDKLVGFVRDVTSEKERMELTVEKRAAEELLLNMLPPEIATRLKRDPTHIADHFACATILFADIVGFTKMSNTMEPIQVVHFLNDLFSRFDETLDKYNLNKVKTIGDCYMVTSIPGGSDSCTTSAAVCHFAFDMIAHLNDYNEETPGRPLNLRIGMNAGPVVAGVVGTKRFLYDLWGDAVNIASRMESTGVPGKIQVTQALIDVVPKEEFIFEKRGSVSVKGIGEMDTFFLTERKTRRGTAYWDSLRQNIRGTGKGFFERFNELELLTKVDQIEEAGEETQSTT